MKDEVREFLISLFQEADLDTLQELISVCVEKYKPIAHMILNEIFQIYKEYKNCVGNNDVFKTTAQMKKSMFDAYRQVGFTEEQTMMFMLDPKTRTNDLLVNFIKGTKASNKGD